VKTRARRDDARFLGKESTVPVRLMYRIDGDTQTPHDVLNTRVRTSSDSKQVCMVSSRVSMPSVCPIGMLSLLPLPLETRCSSNDVFVCLFYSLSEYCSLTLGGLRAEHS